MNELHSVHYRPALKSVSSREFQVPIIDTMDSLNAGSVGSIQSTTPILKTGLRTRSRCCPSIFGHHMITVEPVIFLFMLTQSIAIPVLTQFLLVRTCTINFNFNSSTCHELEDPKNNSKVLETKVQPLTTEILMTKKVIESLVPAVIALFLGPWSDKYGRKTPIIWALLAYAAQYLIAVIISLIPTLQSEYIFTASVPFILSGGYMTISACTITLLTDISSVQSRSLRMGIFEGFLYLGYVMGMFLTSPIFKAFGKDSYTVVFAFNGVVCFLNAIYVYVFIPESVEIEENENAPYKNLTKLFDWQFVKRTLQVCFTKRDECRRDIILYMAIIMAANLFVFDGESVILYLFTRLKFTWEIEHFTIFIGLTVLLMSCGTFIGVSLFSTYLKIDDLNFISFSLVSKFVTSLISANSNTDWHMYFGGACSMFGAVSTPLARSYISKKVPKEVVGVVFALILAVEGLMPLLAAPVYTSVYRATLTTWPGSVFYVTTVVYVINIFLTSYVMFDRNRSPVLDQIRPN